MVRHLHAYRSISLRSSERWAGNANSSSNSPCLSLVSVSVVDRHVRLERVMRSEVPSTPGALVALARVVVEVAHVNERRVFPREGPLADVAGPA